MRRFYVSFVAFFLLPLSLSRANIITFETTPTGATPVDDAPLSTPYSFAGGSVRFFFDTNGNNHYDAATDVLPVFEHIGADGNNGYVGTFNGMADTARPGYEAQLGTYFVRQPDALGVVPGPFIAEYSTTAPIRALSGEIWDIDGSSPDDAERWRVDVLGATGKVLASTLSPNGISHGPESLDSLPWLFQFTNLPDGVTDLRLTDVGTRDRAGLAFNNFSPDVSAPEPTGLAILALAALARLLRRR